MELEEENPKTKNFLRFYRKRNQKKQKSSKAKEFNKIFSIVLSTAILSTYISYQTHQKLVELHNLKNFYTSANSIETPYNLYVKQESHNDTVYAYLVNSATEEKLQIYKNMAVGNIDYRLDSIIGNKTDDESILGKVEKTKTSFIDQIKKLFSKNYHKENTLR